MLTFMDVNDLAYKAVHDQYPDKLGELFSPYDFPYYAFMYYLTAALGDCFCVELGVEKGRGCISLASGSKDAVVLGLDNHTYAEWGAIHDTYPNVAILEHASLPPDEMLLYRPIDILHIDTEHSYSMAREEYEQYCPHLADGAIVLFDDLHAQEDGVLDYFTTISQKRVRMDALHPVCGYGFVYVKRDQ